MKTTIRLGRVLSAVIVAGLAIKAQGAPQKSCSLTSKRSAEAVDRVEAVLEVSGNLKVADAADPEGAKATPLKMSATAALIYAEKSLAVAKTDAVRLRAVRYYEKATAAIRVADDEVKPTLRDQRRLIAVEVAGPKITSFSPRGTLTREELDLVELLGNSLLLDRLLPEKSVDVGDSWKHPEEVIAALCTLDKLTRCDAKSVLTEVTDAVAKIELSGQVEGSANGLSTKIELKAKYRFDTKAGRITWFGLLVKEDRKPGLVGPGLDVVARLQMKIIPQQTSSELEAKALAGLTLEPDEDLQRVEYRPPGGGWRLAHDRRWVVINERKESTVLRMVDGGDYVAQCNVASGGQASDKETASLEQFQEEIRSILGKSFGQFLRAGEYSGESGERIYRVEASGEVSELPIHWMYYRVSDGQGRRLVVAFTIKADLVERFQESDKDFIQAMQFDQSKVAGVKAGGKDASAK